MAKAIIIIKNSSGGSLKVTDAGVPSGTSAVLKVGDVISFTESYPGIVGDTVSFVIGTDSKAAQLIKVSSASTASNS